MRDRGAARPPKVTAPTSLDDDSGEGNRKTSAKSAAGSASAPGDSAWSADNTAKLARVAATIVNLVAGFQVIGMEAPFSGVSSGR